MAWEPKPEQICSETGVYYTREDIEAYGGSSEHLWGYFKNWQRREEFRFSYNVYQRIMWHTVDGHPMAYRELFSDRYPHIPKSEPGKIAYTESDLKGNRDIQTVTTIGRYLTKFHAALSEAEKKRLVDEWNSYYDTSYQLAFSDDPETIAKIYQNGPSSCMSKSTEDFSDYVPFGKHPAEVYGAPGDLSIAYLGTVERPVSRAIVNVQKKYYVRAYGFVERMELKLKEAGFEKLISWPPGTKLNLWQDGSRILCPYLDGSRGYCWVYPSDDGFLVTRHADEGGPGIEADTTDGYIDFDRNTCTCDHCDREVVLDDDDYSRIDGNVVCHRCRDEEYIYCQLTGNYVSNDTDMAIYYDRYNYEEVGQLSELENNSRYTQCEYSYDVDDLIRFYYHSNTTTIELNDGRTIHVACVLHDEAMQHYLEEGLIDLVDDDDESEADEASIGADNKGSAEVTASFDPTPLVTTRGRYEWFTNTDGSLCVRWVDNFWNTTDEAA